MKFSLVSVITMACAAMASTASTIDMTLLSYNIGIRATKPGDIRRRALGIQIRGVASSNNQTLMCLQEAVQGQVDYIKESLGDDWDHIGMDRSDLDDSNKSEAFSPIFYNKKKWIITKNSTLWLGDEGKSPRIATLGRFQHIETDKELLYLCVHLDDQSARARQRFSRRLSKRLYNPLTMKNQGVKLFIASDIDLKAENGTAFPARYQNVKDLVNDQDRYTSEKALISPSLEKRYLELEEEEEEENHDMDNYGPRCVENRDLPLMTGQNDDDEKNNKVKRASRVETRGFLKRLFNLQTLGIFKEEVKGLSFWRKKQTATKTATETIMDSEPISTETRVCLITETSTVTEASHISASPSVPYKSTKGKRASGFDPKALLRPVFNLETLCTQIKNLKNLGFRKKTQTATKTATETITDSQPISTETKVYLITETSTVTEASYISASPSFPCKGTKGTLDMTKFATASPSFPHKGTKSKLATATNPSFSGNKTTTTRSSSNNDSTTLATVWVPNTASNKLKSRPLATTTKTFPTDAAFTTFPRGNTSPEQKKKSFAKENFIFVNDPVGIDWESYKVLSNKAIGGIYISDHRGIVVDLKLDAVAAQVQVDGGNKKSSLEATIDSIPNVTKVLKGPYFKRPPVLDNSTLMDD